MVGAVVGGACEGRVVVEIGVAVTLGTRVGIIWPGVRNTLIQMGGVRMAGSMGWKA
jgi:hypothetical protein